MAANFIFCTVANRREFGDFIPLTRQIREQSGEKQLDYDHRKQLEPDFLSFFHVRSSFICFLKRKFDTPWA